MKKLSIGLALLSLSSSFAYAGGVDYEERGVFNVGVEFLYVEPSSSDFLYANMFGFQADSEISANNQKFKAVDPSNDWAYHVDLSYTMAGSNPNFTLGWTHLDTRDSSSMRFDGLTASQNGAPARDVFDFVANFINSGTFYAGVTSVAGRTEYEYTDVDLIMGKEFVLQNRYHFNPFAGVRYAEIESQDHIKYINTNAQVGRQLHSRVELRNDFDGVGPRVGTDIAIEISDSFSLVARAASSIIIGSLDWSATAAQYQYNGNDLAITNLGESRDHDVNIIVPEVEYRVGVNYIHEFSPETTLIVEAGWSGMHYVDVIDKTLNRAYLGSTGLMTDWSVQGPYLKLTASVD